MVLKQPAAVFFVALAVFLLLSITSLSSGATSGSIPSSIQEQRESAAQKFVTEALRTWQQRLDLKDWNIHVELVRPDALEPKTLGNVHWDLNTKHATIDVLSAYDYTLPTPEMLNDMEFTVVHELVHLHLASLPRSEASVRTEEHVVNELARALLNLARHQLP
jgi:hypothetical protein